MKREKHIKQIIPADNWWAYYDCRGNKNVPEKVVVERLVCWALVSVEGAGEDIEGMASTDNHIDTCEDVSNFKGYLWALNEQGAIKAARAILGDQEAA